MRIFENNLQQTIISGFYAYLGVTPYLGSPLSLFLAKSTCYRFPELFHCSFKASAPHEAAYTVTLDLILPSFLLIIICNRSLVPLQL